MSSLDRAASTPRRCGDGDARSCDARIVERAWHAVCEGSQT
jgi:hypothetical protein